MAVHKQFIFLMLKGAFLIWFLLSALPGQAVAQESLHIDIYGPGQPELNLHLAQPLPLEDQDSVQVIPEFVQGLQAKIQRNMEYLPFLQQIDDQEIFLESAFLQGVKSEHIDFEPLRLSQVDVLLTIGWQIEEDAVRAEFRLFDVYGRELMVGRGYVLEEKRQVAEAGNRFSAEIMEQLTGNAGFFRSELAFVQKVGDSKEIYTSTPQGDNLSQVSEFDQICLSPAWSWDGQKLAFTLVGQDRHELVIWDREEDNMENILLPVNTIISPVFNPQGEVVLSADPEGRPDIFILDDQGQLGQKLAESWAIDISPEFDRAGDKMVFVSSRQGNPHIFLLDINEQQVRRISFEGTYNTNPSLSPDGRFVAYSRQTPDGHRIIMHDLESGREKQLTSGPGNDEDPAWGPDSFFIAFSSNRSGEYKLYLTTRHGDQPQKIHTGSGQASFPAWNQNVQ